MHSPISYAPPFSWAAGLPYRSVLGFAALAGLLGGCGSSGHGVSVRNSPDNEVAIGNGWVFRPGVNSGTVIEIDIVEGPSAMREGDSGGSHVFWTPSLEDLGEHDVVLDITVLDVDIRTGAFQTSARIEFVLRVHQGLDLGVNFSPRGFPHLSTPADVLEHYEARECGRVRAFHEPWRDGLDQAGQIPGGVAAALEEARRFGFMPAIGISWTDANGLPDLTSNSSSENSWLNSETRQEFLDMAEALAMEWQPPYLFLGNETERYFESSSPAEWEAWMSELEACASAVHSVSPGTLVFTTFQLEFLMGLGANAGRSGAPRWELVDRLREAGFLDAVGFATFPHLEYDAVSEVPPTHWSSIREHWDGPVVFTEVAWPAAPRGAYPGDEIEQAEFVSAFLDGVAGLDVKYAAWAFLHEPDPEPSAQWLGSVGLRDNLGLELRAADAIWLAETALRQR